MCAAVLTLDLCVHRRETRFGERQPHCWFHRPCFLSRRLDYALVNGAEQGRKLAGIGASKHVACLDKHRHPCYHKTLAVHNAMFIAGPHLFQQPIVSATKEIMCRWIRQGCIMSWAGPHLFQQLLLHGGLGLSPVHQVKPDHRTAAVQQCFERTKGTDFAGANLVRLS